MAATLTEYEYLSTDKMREGIIDTIVKESPFLANLPFMEIEGNALKYNLETALAGMSWYTVGSVIGESAPTWAQRSTDLTVLAGDIDVDQFMKQTRKDQDIEAALVEKKAKALAHEFEKNMVMGRTTTATDDKQFKGLLRLLAECESATTEDLDQPNNGQLVKASDTSGELTLALLDELIDKVKPKPDALMMSRRMRRKLNTLARASGTTLRVFQNEWGKFISLYDEIPVYINDWVPDNMPDGSSGIVTISSFNQATARATGYDNSIIFALAFGEDGLCGLHNGGVQVDDVGIVANADAMRKRLKFYCGLALFSTVKGAALINVLDTALS